MKRVLCTACLAAGLATLPGCITINVYFPAEAAEKLAGKVIECTRSTSGEIESQDNPAIDAAIKSMRERHEKLVPYYASGAVGFANNAELKVREANLIPLAERAAVGSLIAAENQDRTTIIREKIRAADKPEWEPELRATFAREYADKAESGWYYQNKEGEWVKK